MKPLKVVRESEQVRLDLDFPYTGELNVQMIDSSEKVSVEKMYFQNGVAVITAPVDQRIFYQVEIDQVVYLGAERRVPIAGLYNCRDLGGYVNEENQMVKWGIFYRSDALDHLQTADIEYLEKMNIAAVVDFRSPEEIKGRPDFSINEQKHYNFDPHAEVARQASETPQSQEEKGNKDQKKVNLLNKIAQTESGRQKLVAMQKQMVQQMRELIVSEHAKKSFQQFLKVLIHQEVPMIFHCQGGKDRTGWGAALILSLLGVDKQTIYQDYLLTDQYNAPRNQMRMEIYQQYTDDPFVLDYLASLQKTSEEYLDSAFDAIEEVYGDVETYAVEGLNITKKEILQLRKKYLIP